MEALLQEQPATGIEVLLRKLHQARQDREHYKMMRMEKEAQFRVENDHLYSAEEAFRIEAMNLEDQIRARAVTAYKSNPDLGKAVCPGVGIRVMTDVKYSNSEALEWAKEHKMCLTLDTKAFTALCKSDSTRPNFAEVAEVITATIATDLSSVFEKAGA